MLGKCPSSIQNQPTLFSQVEIGGQRSVTPDYSKHDKTKQMVMLSNYVGPPPRTNESELKASAKKYIVTTDADVIRNTPSPSTQNNLSPSDFVRLSSRNYH